MPLAGSREKRRRLRAHENVEQTFCCEKGIISASGDGGLWPGKAVFGVQSADYGGAKRYPRRLDHGAPGGHLKKRPVAGRIQQPDPDEGNVFPALSGGDQFSPPVLPECDGASVYRGLYGLCLCPAPAGSQTAAAPHPVPGASVESHFLFSAGVSEGIPQQHFLYSGAVDFRRLPGSLSAKTGAGEKADRLDYRGGGRDGQLFLYPGGCHLGRSLPGGIYAGVPGKSGRALEERAAESQAVCGEGGAGTAALPVHLGGGQMDRPPESVPLRHRGGERAPGGRLRRNVQEHDGCQAGGGDPRRDDDPGKDRPHVRGVPDFKRAGTLYREQQEDLGRRGGRRGELGGPGRLGILDFPHGSGGGRLLSGRSYGK